MGFATWQHLREEAPGVADRPLMRILLATKLMDVGGIERSVVILARELCKRGHAVWVVSSGGRLVADLASQGAQHVFAPLEITSPLGVAQSARTIRALIRRERIQLIHSFSATASIAVNLALGSRWEPWAASDRIRRPPRPHLISSPLGLQNSPRELALTTWLRNWFLALGAERVLAISPEIRRHLKRVGVNEQLLLDFNFVGLDVDAFESTADDRASVLSEFGFDPSVQLVTTIGALHPRKSHDLFLEAATRVAARMPDARFLVVGEGALRVELERRAQLTGLGDRVVFTGIRGDIARILTATDVYVKPGIVEGYVGITVLEALALGRPVVAFDTEDVKLALRDGETGLVVPNGDVDALAERIVYVLRHPEVGQALGEAGRKVVRERFHFSRLAERLECFYEEILGNNREPARVGA